MNFLKIEDDIIKFIEKNFSGSEITYVKNAPVDLDKYKTKNTVFFDFVGFNFERLSNISDIHNISLNIHIVCRNDTAEKIRERLLNFTSEFYDFFQTNKSLGGAVDDLNIEKVDFYFEPSGTNIIQISTLELRMKVEEC